MAGEFLRAALIAVLVCSFMGPSFASGSDEFETPGADEIHAFRSENLAAFVQVPKKGWCRIQVNVNLRIRSDSVFAGEQPELNAFLDELPGILTNSCAVVRNIAIRGYIAQRRVYQGSIQSANTAAPRVSTRITDRRIADAYRDALDPGMASNHTASQQPNEPNSRHGGRANSESEPTRPEVAKGRLFTDATSVGLQCDVLSSWVQRLYTEYPQADFLAINAGELEDVTANLFGDEDFVPVFGRRFDEAGAAERARIFKNIYMRCPRELRRTPPYNAVFRTGFMNIPHRMDPQALKRKVEEGREIRSWLRQQLEDLDRIPVSTDGLARVVALSKDSSETISGLWPSEQNDFLQRVGARRSQIALDLAASTIANSPLDPGSLSVLRGIAAEAEVHTIALDRARLETIARDANKRYEAIRVALVEREIDALQDVPTDLNGLRMIAHRRSAILATVGEAPNIEALERYKTAFRDRGREIASEGLQRYVRDLNALPETFAGAEKAVVAYEDLDALLKATAEDVRGLYKSAAVARANEIYEQLVDVSIGRILEFAAPAQLRGWEHTFEIVSRSQKEADLFGDTLASLNHSEMAASSRLRLGMAMSSLSSPMGSGGERVWGAVCMA